VWVLPAKTQAQKEALGLAGGFALVTAVEGGCPISGSGETPWGLAGDRLHLLATVANCERGRAADARLSV
jgi:hypothetical protein